MLRTSIDTTNLKDSRRGPPLVMRTDMPFFRPSTVASRDRNGRTCTTSVQSCIERSAIKKPRVNKKARALWSIRDAQENGEPFCFAKVVNEKLRVERQKLTWAGEQSCWKNLCDARKMERQSSAAGGSEK